ncbi:MAG TPA: hypothetical protein VH112_01350 [Acidimicrobiales bacterium]|jgi:hypothetical protein|nr:hypothetical protein [Acidimicrobiales bacterium]
MKQQRMTAAAALVVASMLVTACSSGPDVSGTLSQRVNGWSQGVGLTASSAKIGSELDQVTKTAQAGDLGGLQAVSVQLQDDATIAHAQLPSPDQSLTDQLNTAYQTAYQLANHYLDKGAGSNRAAGLAAVISQADAAQRALQAARARATTFAHS